MDTFVQRFAGKIKGVITGFNRIVFKGCLRPLMFADGAMSFLRSRGVLNKDYKPWVMAQSRRWWRRPTNMRARRAGEESRPFLPAMSARKLSLMKDSGSWALKAGSTDGNGCVVRWISRESPLCCTKSYAPSIRNSIRIRPLDVTGKDREFLQAIADPLYAVEGIANKNLRQKQHVSPWANRETDKQLSARLARHLRLLRDHGLIRKIPNQRKYILTPQGHTLTTALTAILAASTQQLMEIAS